VIESLLYAGTRYFADLLILAAVMAAQAFGARLLWREPAAAASRRIRHAILTGTAISYTVLVFGFLLRFSRVNRHFPELWNIWVRGFAITWAVLSVLMVAVYAISRQWLRVRPEHSAARRGFLRTAQAALFCAPAALIGYGVFIERFDLRMREQDLVFPDLPEDLHGLRLVQLTDIHLSPFLSEHELARAVDMANETRAHLALVTGDLITYPGDPVDVCLNQLTRLRADAGVLGCMGNHEIYAGVEDYVEAQGQRLGLPFLRQRAKALRFGSATLNVAGVDYQHKGRPYLRGAHKLVDPQAFNILLSHNPDVFPVAARQGFRFTSAGHTHGGQVRVEILRQDLNVARFFTPYVDGLYRQNGSAIFVSRGIGTIAFPARFGAPPEVALLRLCRT
jgi:uncharacterized protein